MFRRQPVPFMSFVQLPLLLSVITALVIYIWPDDTTSGFNSMIRMVGTLQQPASTIKKQMQAANIQIPSKPIAEKPAEVTENKKIQWTEAQVMNEEFIKKNEKIAGEISRESEEQSLRTACKNAQAAYIDDPSEDNKSAMELTCIGLD